ncbi:hypothetical protein PRIPAC_98086 [Pristionchus pacificus]|uniref:Carboxylic ester hydrolase n=1 Tax=Pristionchus pacificus TaxID=54126 RepID=A0A2A6D219_PRIPA|nr:hypothetical protein PRIPAC_98086 [Pristionchus pacificus]|eukprot:PDM84448.1 hydrolase [Pristionchus pacificus]
MGDRQSCPDSRIVETSCGKVQGRRLIYKEERQVEAFQGIPFAKPPVGKLRFKKPEPPEKWDGIKETKKFGPRAIVTPFVNGFVENLLRGTPSEDCLYLNVFTPCWKAPQGGLPVMIFVHGGAFELGDAQIFGDLNICDNIVTRGVVFITIQYRLGYLGFLSTGDAACPGNNGLWDQTAALRWVNDNIEAFGGNKNNITLLGQSAGGASVDLLHLSPHSTNLFHKVIPMAGNAECRWATNKNMPQQCRNKAARLGITAYETSEELLDKLRALPAEKFAVNFRNREKEPDVNLETVPILDGDFFPESIDEMRKKAKPKPLMTGVCTEEGLFFIPGKKPTEQDLNEVVNFAVHEAEDKNAIAADLKSVYLPDGIPADKDVFMRSIANIASDYFFNAGTIELCRKTVALQVEFDDEDAEDIMEENPYPCTTKQRTKSFLELIKHEKNIDRFVLAICPSEKTLTSSFGTWETKQLRPKATAKRGDEAVYLYQFEHFNPKVMGFAGRQLPIQDATHASELIYLFKKGLFTLTEVSLTDEDKHAMHLFTTAFTNFAKYG